MHSVKKQMRVKTRITASPAVAARLILEGRVVAFPTETVYGLGALALDERSVRMIFDAKGRPADNPLIVHIGAREQVKELVRKLPKSAERLMDAFWPGPLTIVLPRSNRVSDAVTAGLDTVGIRLPSHPVALAFLRVVGVPVAAPSANRSGRPSPTSWQAVQQDLDGRIAAILKGPRSRVGLESTVVDCSGRVPVVLRAGAVSLEELREVVRGTRSASRADVEQGRSPGLRHRHYAPRARVFVGGETPARFPARSAWIGVGKAPRGVALSESCRDVRAYARALFHFFRRCEGVGIRQIYCQTVSTRGIGAALMDRLRRAAAGSVKPVG